jgi:DNA-binding PadR family transcriptional regulator
MTATPMRGGRPRRRYYTLTQMGRRQLKESEARIQGSGA